MSPHPVPVRANNAPSALLGYFGRLPSPTRLARNSLPSAVLTKKTHLSVSGPFGGTQTLGVARGGRGWGGGLRTPICALPFQLLGEKKEVSEAEAPPTGSEAEDEGLEKGTSGKKRNNGTEGSGFPPFLPQEAEEIEEEAAVQLLRRIQRLPVNTGLSGVPLPSSCVIPRNAGSATIPIILLHGFDSSCLEWRRVYGEMEEQGLEPWAVDILGWGFHGTQEAGVRSFSVEAKREHLFQFWKQHMGSRPCIVVGASLGGSVALDLTLNHPEMVAGLVLVDAQGYAEGVGGMADFPDWLARAGVAVLKSVPLRLYAATLAYHDATLATRDAMRVGRLHCHMPGWQDAKLDFMRSGGYDVASRIPEVQKPTLIVWGKQDRILDVSFAQRFFDDLPNAQVELLDSCGHLPHLELPKALSSTLLSYHTSLEIQE